MMNKHFLFLISIFAIMVSCTATPPALDSKNPPPLDTVTAGAASLGLMMNVANLATGNMIQSRFIVNVNYGISCVGQKFSIELVKQDTNKVIFYQDTNSSEQIIKNYTIPTGHYKLSLYKADKKSLIDHVEINLKENDKAMTFHLKACN